MHILPSEVVVTWKVKVGRHTDERDGHKPVIKAQFTHSTLRGMLICKEDLQRTQPCFVPQLSPWGEARRCVLNLCDGQRTLLQIEDEVYRCHPGLFPSPGKAAEFVAEVITRYSL
jgi:hypothetical protein